MTLAPQQFKMCSTLQLLADGVLMGQLFCSDAWWAGAVVGPPPRRDDEFAGTRRRRARRAPARPHMREEARGFAARASAPERQRPPQAHARGHSGDVAH